MVQSEKAQEFEKKIMDLEDSISELFTDCFNQPEEDWLDRAAQAAAYSEDNLDDNQSEQAKLRSFAQNFHHDVKLLAKFYMQQFFSDKTMHCGGKVPNFILFLERRISLVINYDISTGVQQAYKAMSQWSDAYEEADENEDLAKSSNEAPADVKLVNETLSLLAQSGVPRQFAGGMLLLYLEFVEGIEFGP